MTNYRLIFLILTISAVVLFLYFNYYKKKEATLDPNDFVTSKDQLRYVLQD